jgi:hypothetical protein
MEIEARRVQTLRALAQCHARFACVPTDGPTDCWGAGAGMPRCSTPAPRLRAVLSRPVGNQARQDTENTLTADALAHAASRTRAR